MEFWLGGEGHIPEEYIDVNKSDGVQKIFDVLERSPLVEQLDKRRVDQQRKKLMALSRYAGSRAVSHVAASTGPSLLDWLPRWRWASGSMWAFDGPCPPREERARAGNETEEAITNAMVELAAEPEGEHGFPIGASEPNTAGPMVMSGWFNGPHRKGLDELSCPAPWKRRAWRAVTWRTLRRTAWTRARSSRRWNARPMPCTTLQGQAEDG